MRSIASAWEARATDVGSYQVESVSEGDVSIEQLASALSPTYIRNVPRVDGWGKPFLLRVMQSGKGYSILSSGANGTTPGMATPDEDDLQYGAGNLIHAPLSVRPVITATTFLPELILGMLVGEWRDDQGICLRITRPGIGYSSVGASVEPCNRVTWAVGSQLRVSGRTLTGYRDQTMLALSWNGTLDGTIAGMFQYAPELATTATRGYKQFTRGPRGAQAAGQ